MLKTLTVGSNYMDKNQGSGGYPIWLENLDKDVKKHNNIKISTIMQHICNVRDPKFADSFPVSLNGDFAALATVIVNQSLCRVMSKKGFLHMRK